MMTRHHYYMQDFLAQLLLLLQFFKIVLAVKRFMALFELTIIQNLLATSSFVTEQALSSFIVFRPSFIKSLPSPPPILFPFLLVSLLESLLKF